LSQLEAISARFRDVGSLATLVRVLDVEDVVVDKSGVAAEVVILGIGVCGVGEIVDATSLDLVLQAASTQAQMTTGRIRMISIKT
jgi:hypothetical protein